MAHILYRRNKHLYKLLAYRVTLKRRYQILENIKVLSFLWPTILLFSTVAPIGIILTIIYTAIFKTAAPTSLFLIMYNVAFTLAIAVRIRENLKRQSAFATTENRNEKKIVKSPFGRILPTSVSPENYFNGLRQQWA
uniref:Uncharacterized protein n=1 Tax=Panagrolaimus sp. PS1159 TaxID=55785 RepID=A0AC35G0Q6_9BILA